MTLPLRAIAAAGLLILGGIPSCRSNSSHAADPKVPPSNARANPMPTTSLKSRIESLPEITLPPEWSLVPEDVRLPARWRAIVDAAGSAKLDAAHLAAKYANDGRPFKSTDLFNSPPPDDIVITVVSTRLNEFITIPGREYESPGGLEQSLSPERAALLRRILGETP
jgi:hypothetical protein